MGDDQGEAGAGKSLCSGAWYEIRETNAQAKERDRSPEDQEAEGDGSLPEIHSRDSGCFTGNDQTEDGRRGDSVSGRDGYIFPSVNRTQGGFLTPLKLWH